MKTVENWLCTECGCTQKKWTGMCSACKEWNTMEKFVEVKDKKREYGNGNAARPIVSLAIDTEKEERISTGFKEIDRVFGDGVALGSMNLVGGSPGIGKSTLMLQFAKNFCLAGKKVLYVCGEESCAQTANRAKRLNALHENLYLLSETEFTIIRKELDQMKPDIFILDSIQIVYKAELHSLPGSVQQVKEIAVECMHIAKQKDITTFIIGHVTKGGDLAGPKVLEHLVDAVVDFEGDKEHDFRMLRAHKNRFGPTDEVAIMQMDQKGLVEVENPSKFFLEERAEGQPGSVIGATMEGSKPMLVEVQALVAPSVFPNPSRRANGIDPNRLAIILAVLEKRMGYHLQNFDVFVSIAGGLKVKDPALDLAVAVAIASSFSNKVIDGSTLVLGEIGLGGEIRSVHRMDRRVKEAMHLGFKRAVVPKCKKEEKIALPLKEVKRIDEAIKSMLTDNH